MGATHMKNKPALQVVAGEIARFFGIHFYDLLYGQKDLSSCSAPVGALLQTEVRKAKPQDLNRIVCRIGREIHQQFDHNIAINSTCYVAVHEGVIAGYLWVNRQTIDLIGMYLAGLPPGYSFVHSVFVFPEHRRKGIFQCMFCAACHEMQKAESLSVACLVDKANRPSVAAFKRMGMRFHNAIVVKLPGIKPVLFCRALA